MQGMGGRYKCTYVRIYIEQRIGNGIFNYNLAN